jgi:hypothetical protein
MAGRGEFRSVDGVDECPSTRPRLRVVAASRNALAFSVAFVSSSAVPYTPSPTPKQAVASGNTRA